jgi:hypothetical protein
MRKRKKLLVGLVAVAAVLVAVRVALPHIVKAQINSRLAEMGDYGGHVSNVDLALLRGAYALHDLTVVKRNLDREQPFLELETLDMSIQWGALWDGSLVGEAILLRPRLNLVQGEGDSDSQLGRGINWPDEVRQLFPFNFNRVEVDQGTVTFRAPGIDADHALDLRELHAEVRNLTNVKERDRQAFAEFQAQGKILGHAPVKLQGRLDPNEDLPALDFNLELEDADLVEVNPWLRAFLNVDAEKGTFSLYSEMATAEGRFEGYVKPILEDATIFRLDEEASNPLQKVWEALVELAANIFENPPEDQVATRIPLSGELESPDADLLSTFVNLSRNAFVAAFSHSIEGRISMKDVTGDQDTESNDA